MIGGTRSQRFGTLFLVLAWCLAYAGYLAFAARLAGSGFPLDDAWIHQTYARSLGREGAWAFLPGQPSSGSTSPAWTALLSVGYALGLAGQAWAVALGLLLQLLLALVLVSWSRSRCQERTCALWVFGIALLEWHLLWAALSGMEILLTAFLAGLVFMLLERRSTHTLLLGALIGAGIWIRPDALTLLLPALWVLGSRRHAGKVRAAAWLVVGVAVFVLPYVWFNYRIEGTFWPSTYYAKQAEYAVLRELPLFQRLFAQLRQPLTGAGLLLLPGVAWSVWQSLRQRAWSRLAPAVWACAYVGAYALRLPVTYQHGRYAMPVIPVLIVLGVEGMLDLGRRAAPKPAGLAIYRAWAISLAAVVLAFLPLGGRAYGMDVAVIQTEMVAPARWIAAYTDQGALIAAHDIGALGYFSGRSILDLAGLVSPEVIPILRDEDSLRNLLNRRHVEYLMTFPGWYPTLTSGLERVYISSGEFSPLLGGENMVVYRWRP